MTQQIKFRGFRTDVKGWVEGDLINYGDLKSIRVYKPVELTKPSEYPVIPSSLGMFTGRTDKNGKEIYTGDLIREKFFGFDGSEYFEERLVVLDFSILTEPIYPEYTEIIGVKWDHE